MTITGDTDPANPVNEYPANVFPIGAALTVAYGSTESMLCTLGNLYRIVGYLTGDVPSVDGQPARAADPELGIAEQPYIPSLNEEIARCARHVEGQLPDTLRAIDPPPYGRADTVVLAYLGRVANVYGHTIELVALPGTPNNPNQGTNHA